MHTSLHRLLACLVAVPALLAVSCGDDETTDTGGQPLATEFACVERTSFHGDPAPDTSGAATRDEAIAEAAADYGAPSLARESGDTSIWNIHDDDGNLVGTIEVGPAPAGGFIAGEHELCADAVDHGEEGDMMAEPPEDGPVVAEPLPDPGEWAWPGDSGDVVVHLLVDFSVGDGFEPVGIEVAVDGLSVVSGQGFHRPEEHCNWWGGYDMLLEPGTHSVEVRTSDGLELAESFDVSGEATAIANYTDAGYGETDQPTLAWWLIDGTTGCD